MRGYPWAGPALLPMWVGLHLFLSPTPLGELIFFAGLAALGFLIDTALIQLNLFTLTDGRLWAPGWLVAMWVLLGLTYESMLGWRKRTWLLLLAGGITGPLTYIWCEAVNLLSYTRPLWLALAIHGIGWALLTPLLFRLRDFSLLAVRKPARAHVPQEIAEILESLDRELKAPLPREAPDWMAPRERDREQPPAAP